MKSLLKLSLSFIKKKLSLSFFHFQNRWVKKSIRKENVINSSRRITLQNSVHPQPVSNASIGELITVIWIIEQTKTRFELDLITWRYIIIMKARRRINQTPNLIKTCEKTSEKLKVFNFQSINVFSANILTFLTLSL